MTDTDSEDYVRIPRQIAENCLALERAEIASIRAGEQPNADIESYIKTRNALAEALGKDISDL